ncbi:Epidermal growth factor receptor kinase substrate 8-like protein isoform 2 [Schistosoma japonicum]|uniref:Epidermal growth factor receptor kinase substrate 8-like protein isoform 2 n=2 Tax=Schistosoma japonicum TaxID=6182 RepID=A0A4Z2DG90_SCHJA|nr:Epidermal growth factor receptor kinase substrate 8-like protein isoform 2 [Schistosoma japonicum]
MSTTYSSVADDGYGQDLYMLNGCLDDIEWFEKKLRKGLKFSTQGHKSRSNPNKQHSDEELPSSTVAIDSLQKIKFSLNITEKIRKSLPYLSKEVFIYLIKIVRKLHTVAKQKHPGNYNPNIVVDVIEPLLNEATITSIFNLLSVRAKELWLDLGPAWNTPNSKWPNPLKIYMPTFNHQMKQKRTRNRSNEVINRNQVFNSQISLKEPTEVDHEYEPHFHGGLRYFRVDDKEYLAYQRFCKRFKQRDEFLGEYSTHNMKSVNSKDLTKKEDCLIKLTDNHNPIRH